MADKGEKPTLFVLAGPNGAGKTTFAREFLPDFGCCRHFLNADLIAERLANCPPEAVTMRSGRRLLQEIAKLTRTRQTFALETTLSGKVYAPLFKRLKKQGYVLHMFFLWLPSVEIALERVMNRVRHGGHPVADEIVRRRYARGIRNLMTVYRPLFDSWILFDNSGPVPRQVAFEQQGRLQIVDQQSWKTIEPLG